MRNKNYLLLFIALSTAVLLSSCARDYDLKFAGRYHPDVTPLQKAQATVLQKGKENQNTIALLPDQNPFLMTASAEENLAPLSAPSKKIIIKNATKSAVQTVPVTEFSRPETALPEAQQLNRNNHIEAAHLSKLQQLKEKLKNAAAATTNSNNKVLYAIISIFIPFLGVGLYEQGITSHFWIDLILTLLFYVPGLIYALILILG